MSDDPISSLVSFMLGREPWMDYAACKGMGPKKFFPERGESKRPGQDVCSRCPVTSDCNEYADRSGSDYGMWGGHLRTRGVPLPHLFPVECQPVDAPIEHVFPSRPPTKELRMVVPVSLSATSAMAYEECPARWLVEFFERTPTPGGTAASLGTACHETFEEWVKEGHYKAGYPKDHEWSVMKALYDIAYWAVFSDSSRYAEGVKLCQDWLARQNWEGRTVLSTEQKLHFVIKSSAGEIPFNYVMDRVDRLDNGDIEVVDYKSLIRPVTPEQLKHKLQARAYALAAQLLYPDANRVWVGFDLLRYNYVGTVFTKEESRVTWTYLHTLAERIIKDEVFPEQLGEGCRYCVRKSVCDSLQKHAKAGGPLGLDDMNAVAKRYYEMTAAQSAIKIHLEELEAAMLAHMKSDDLLQMETIGHDVAVTVSGRRGIGNQEVLANILGPELMVRYGSLTLGKLDEILESEPLTDAQKSMVRMQIRKNYGEPKIKVERKSPF